MTSLKSYLTYGESYFLVRGLSQVTDRVSSIRCSLTIHILTHFSTYLKTKILLSHGEEKDDMILVIKPP